MTNKFNIEDIYPVKKEAKGRVYFAKVWFVWPKDWNEKWSEERSEELLGKFEVLEK